MGHACLPCQLCRLLHIMRCLPRGILNSSTTVGVPLPFRGPEQHARTAAKASIPLVPNAELRKCMCIWNRKLDGVCCRSYSFMLALSARINHYYID